MLNHLRGIVEKPSKTRVWLYYLWRFALARLRGRTGSAFFSPQRPLMGYSIWKICRELGLRITDKPERGHVVALRWLDVTVDQGDPLAEGTGVRAINEGCRDISKSAVEAASVGAFGYGLFVDPQTYVGPYVLKSEENGLHDGRIVEGPRDPEPGFVYQRLVDNADDNGNIVDLRIPIIGRRIPFVYLRHRPVRERFTQEHERVETSSTSEVLTEEEIDRTLTLCTLMGLDCGELDAVRDRQDGRIYVVDANKTPSGPPAHGRFWDGVRAQARLAAAFEQEFLAHRRARSA
jgi:hypothetical protein